MDDLRFRDLSGFSDWNGTVLDFVNTELNVALTFASIALNAGLDHEKRARNYERAQIAHDAAIRFVAKAELTDSQYQEIRLKVAEVESSLEQLHG